MFAAQIAPAFTNRDNALVQRAHDWLAAAHSAMQECLARHGYANPNH